MDKVELLEIQKDNNFADVTLVCEDGKQVEAHKVILAGQVHFDEWFHSHRHINIIDNKDNIDNNNNNNINIIF